LLRVYDTIDLSSEQLIGMLLLSVGFMAIIDATNPAMT
jgi:hypothetical protein